MLKKSGLYFRLRILTSKDPATYSWNHGSSGFHSSVVPQFHVSKHRFVISYDIIKDHFNYKFIEKKLFHEYEYESEYGSNAFALIEISALAARRRFGTVNSRIRCRSFCTNYLTPAVQDDFACSLSTFFLMVYNVVSLSMPVVASIFKHTVDPVIS